MAATYTAEHIHTGNKVPVSEQEKAQMEQTKVARNFRFTEAKEAPKPARVEPAGQTDADKPQKGNK